MTTSRNGSVVARRLSRHARVSSSPLKTHITRLTRGAARTASLRDSAGGLRPPSQAFPQDRVRRQSRRIDHTGYSDAPLVRLPPVPTIPRQAAPSENAGWPTQLDL